MKRDTTYNDFLPALIVIGLTLSIALAPILNGKHRYIGLGPEFDHTFIVGKKYPFALTLRYFFETGNRVATQGNNMFVALTYVIPKR